MQHVLQHEWTFVQRAVTSIGPLFGKVEEAIHNFFSVIFLVNKSLILHILVECFDATGRNYHS